MGPTNSLLFLLQHVTAVADKQSDQVLQEQLGIGLSQYRILLVLEWNPRVQQRAIADSLGQTEASISRQIKVLQNKGLLVSRVDANNRRKHITAPTPLGMQVTEAATSILRRSFGPDLAALGEDKQMQLITSLQKIHAIVCQDGKLGACDHTLGV